jgi:hypothetical protein
MAYAITLQLQPSRSLAGGPAMSSSLQFDDPAGVLDPSVSCRAFAETSLGRAAGVRLEGERTHFLLDRCLIGGKTFQADILFESQQLSRVELFLVLPNDKKGWENWTQAAEQRRKQQGEAWIQTAFGQAPVVEPLEIDGQKVVPFQPEWDYARILHTNWGKATSYFDSKAGFAGILLLYTPVAS